MGRRPAIILTSKFTTPNKQDFSQYVNYMARKKALEEKGYLTNEEQLEFEKINAGLNDLNIDFDHKNIRPVSSDTEITQEAKSLLNADDGFQKYISYMTRKGALRDQEVLSKQDEQEISRLDKALKDLDFSSNNLNTLPGVFSADKSTVSVNDLKTVKEKMTGGQKHGSILWQDVVSFDNQFLIDKGVLSPETDTLDEELLKKASYKMMETFQKKEKLNNPYWFASIHRNREHIHIHFATIEAGNSRDIQESGELQPRGMRKLSTIDSMKSAFTNEMLNMDDLLDRITKQRNQVRKNIQTAYLDKVNDHSFQIVLNDFVRTLPEDRRKWNYGSLSVNQKKKLNNLVDMTLVNDQEYVDLKESIKRYSENRIDMYGQTTRSQKDYEKNKLAEIQKRNGNAILSELKKTDRQAKFARSKLKLPEVADPDHYIEAALEVTERFTYSIQQKQINPLSKKKNQKKQTLPIRYTRAKARKIANMFSKKKTTSFAKQKALSAYEQLQAQVERAREGS